jgi:hypothetical protein
VSVAPPPLLDAGPQAPEAATSADASNADASERGPTPVWPEAEQQIELAYGASASVELVLDPSPRSLDLHLNVDTTSSFGEEIDALQRELTRSIIPMLRRRIADASFGVSSFADFPRAPFGSPSAPHRDSPYLLLTPITDSVSRVTSAVARLDNPLGLGGDYREAGAESLWQIATGRGYKQGQQSLILPFDGPAAHGGGTIGGVGFRSQALRVVVHVTDAESHTPQDYAQEGLKDTHAWADVFNALRALHVRALGIASTACTDDACRSQSRYAGLREQLSNLAIATGATRPAPTDGCPTGVDGAVLPAINDICPLVFDVKLDGTGLADTLVDAVVGLLDGVRFSEVHAEAGDDPLGLIQGIEVAPVDQPDGIAAPELSDRLPSAKPDGHLDTYAEVGSHNRLGFKISLRNSRLGPSDVPQRYRVAINLLGDETLLEQRYLRVLIPPEPDAGL